MPGGNYFAENGPPWRTFSGSAAFHKAWSRMPSKAVARRFHRTWRIATA